MFDTVKSNHFGKLLTHNYLYHSGCSNNKAVKSIDNFDWDQLKEGRMNCYFKSITPRKIFLVIFTWISA